MIQAINKIPYAVRLYEYNSQYLVLSHNMKTEWHHHPCLQLTVSPHYSKIRIDTEQRPQQAYGFIVASNIKHRLHTEDEPCFNFLVDPIHPLYHLLLHKIKNSDIVYLESESSRLIADYFVYCVQSNTSPNILILNYWLGQLDDCDCYLDDRIVKATTLISELSVKCISSHEISKRLYLSESRFLHLFRQEMGINFRGYLLWKRFHHAFENIHSPNSLTALAYQSGFSDSAHLSRTCMKLYGLRPSELKNASADFADYFSL
ncbi:helix-turn-helix domain-containing protein [Xenorhabdus hominickii]|uniref:Type III secretion system transcriptional regulator BsaN n=1 Tax=Xenorhabdus hominickii TaxID=351679 RepID=A0A2G0QED2_XENHO|nr:helix-turn-helix domain-containing protein [Xenorhabdus hominickii]AOM41632.1 hypothetical protein A9255_14275 [Xenorhabdus hominickii]PHM57580.1 type III secretion system transcriptional regulator BsaN [Xenorhabdus hominickii]